MRNAGLELKCLIPPSFHRVIRVSSGYPRETMTMKVVRSSPSTKMRSNGDRDKCQRKNNGTLWSSVTFTIVACPQRRSFDSRKGTGSSYDTVDGIPVDFLIGIYVCGKSATILRGCQSPPSDTSKNLLKRPLRTPVSCVARIERVKTHTYSQHQNLNFALYYPS